jgi:hypothetical protein
VTCDDPVAEARLTIISKMATQREERLEISTASVDLLRNLDGYEILHVASVDLPVDDVSSAFLHAL